MYLSKVGAWKASAAVKQNIFVIADFRSGSNSDLKAMSDRRPFVPQKPTCDDCIVARSGYEFHQDFLPLPIKIAVEHAEAGNIAARVGERSDKARSDQIFPGGKNWDRFRR